MKVLRLNDRIWFGKHKDERVCDIIKRDPSQMLKILNDKITLDDKSKEFINIAMNGGRTKNPYDSHVFTNINPPKKTKGTSNKTGIIEVENSIPDDMDYPQDTNINPPEKNRFPKFQPLIGEMNDYKKVIFPSWERFDGTDIIITSTQGEFTTTDIGLRNFFQDDHSNADKKLPSADELSAGIYTIKGKVTKNFIKTYQNNDFKSSQEKNNKI